MVIDLEVLLFKAISHLNENRLSELWILVIDESKKTTSFAKSRDEMLVLRT